MSKEQVHAAIDNAVSQGGGTASMAVFLKKIANVESGCDANARNCRSSAKGIFQFIDSTWEANGGGNVWDVATQCRNAVTLAKKNEAALVAVLGREPNAGEYYLAHFAGAAGAKAAIEAAPGTQLSEIPIMRAACRSNPHIRNFTAGELRAWAAGKMGDRVSLRGGGTPEEERKSREEFLLRNTSMTNDQIKGMDVMGQLFLALFMGIMSKAFEKLPAQALSEGTVIADASRGADSSAVQPAPSTPAQTFEASPATSEFRQAPRTPTGSQVAAVSTRVPERA